MLGLIRALLFCAVVLCLGVYHLAGERLRGKAAETGTWLENGESDLLTAGKNRLLEEFRRRAASAFKSAE